MDTASAGPASTTARPAMAVLGKRNLELGPFGSGPTEDGPWANWRTATDEDGIVWLLFDKKDASVNTLSEAVLVEFDAILEKLERQQPLGLVVRSAKPAGFIAGADIGIFRGAGDTAQIEALITRGNAVIDRLDRLPTTTVAVIHGYCLGGGLELALACDRRIAVDGASFGFPEVLLGLHPGFGGTVRLPALIDPVQAMTMMLNGRSVRARRARTLGLVDAVTPERHVRAAVRAAVNGGLSRSKRGFVGTVLATLPARRVLARRMASEAAKRAPRAHYPAPYALIDLWVEHGGDAQAMQRAETASFAKLLVGETAQNLVRVFFLRDTLKGLAGARSNVNRVHVIGAGTMGGDIAAWCAWHGLMVTLCDSRQSALGGAIRRADELYGKVGRHDRRRVRDALDRLIPDRNGDGVAGADLVIEAVPENLGLKRQIFADVEARARPGTILATNTSSIPLEQLRAGLARPERLVGLHFFNPVSRMQVVEVVSHDQAASEALDAARGFLGRIDRLPAPVKSAPGFLVNRALTPYLLEALLMLDSGIKKETIDKAARDFGMPMGPIELADEVGLDICLHVAETLRGSLTHDMPEVPQWLQDKVTSGALGKKTGNGLYEWKDGRAAKASEVPAPPPDATDRLILPMLDACMACLREGVVADETILDGAMVFATGFAPFRGGPMHYARTRGFAAVRDRLFSLAASYGLRFKPDPGWTSE